MKADNITITMSIPMSYGKIYRNGVMFSKEAVENAVKNIPSGLPITYIGNKTTNFQEGVIGATTKDCDVKWDDENQICHLIINGMIFSGGAKYITEMKGNVVSSLRITGFGVSIGGRSYE